MDIKSEKTIKDKRLKKIFNLCPKRHVLLLISLLIIGLYYALRSNEAAMLFAAKYIAQPYHRLAGRIFALFPFSVAELFYAAVIIFTLVYIIISIITIIKKNQGISRAYITIITLMCLGFTIYASVCIFWNVCYYDESFESKSGIEASPVTPQELQTTALYFTSLANEYSDKINRDDDGVFAVERKDVLKRAESIYRNTETEFDALTGTELRLKPMVFSKLFSRMNFTGFFFPFTGEANLNVHSPVSMLPVTAAHEIAHQRGIAMEQEANFIAVLTCLNSEDPDFIYSACLLSYIHIGNALRDADYELWEEVYYSLSDDVREDLRYNSNYWRSFDTKTAKASEAVYTSFLQSQGQSLGMKSYGACVDLLVAYYNPIAQELLEEEG